MKIKNIIYLLVALCLSCSNSPSQVGTKVTLNNELKNIPNYLTMKIDGVEWKANDKIFGIYDYKGYEKQIIIGGSSDAGTNREKVFNVSLNNTTGVGEYHIVDDNKDLNTAIFNNFKEGEEDVCGLKFGVDLIVKVTKASKIPSIVEATFSGTLTCGSDRTISITDGKFYYHE